MTKDKLEEKHICDNVNCNHNNTEGLCLMFNPDVCKYRQLQKENTELRKSCDETQELLDKQIEKMKCCGNCGNERCTSKYRGNSAYHRQADGFACADNEDWKLREIKEK